MRRRIRRGRSGPLHRGLWTLTAMMLSGCADNRPYPTEWGDRPTVTNNTCADISGSYSGCSFEDRTKPRDCPYFFWDRFELRKMPSPGLFSNAIDSHFVIEQSESKLRVVYLVDEKIVAEKELLKDQRNGFSCTTDGIVVSNGGDAQPENMLGWTPGTYTLIKDRQGRLIVEHHESGGGLMLGLIPYAESTTTWMRIDPYARK